MANIEDLYLPYPDFKLQEIIDPEQFDINNEYTVVKMNEVLEILNQLINSTVDGQSGADLINLTPITGFVSNKLQTFLEEVISILQSSIGSTRIGTPALEGLPGSTVAQQLISIKEQLVGHLHDANYAQLNEFMAHKDSADHDERYYPKTDTYARGEFALQRFNPTVETFIASEGQRGFDLVHGSYTMDKNRIEVHVGGVEQTVGIDADNSVLEFSPTKIMLSEGVPAGTIVVLKYYAGDIPIQMGVGHGKSHVEGAYDEIDVTTLKNYDLIATSQELSGISKKHNNVAYVESFENLVVDGNWVPAIQMAHDSLLNGGTIILPNKMIDLKYIGKSELLLFTKPIRLIGWGFYSQLLIDPLVPNTCDVIRFTPNMNFGGTLLEFSNFAILPKSGTPARHGVYIKLDSAEQYVDRLTVNRVFIRTKVGKAFRAENANAFTGGLFTSVLENSTFDGGIDFEGVGDSLTIRKNTITGANIGVRVNLVYGASLPVIDDNNITSRGGAVLIKRAMSPKITNNNIEQTVPVEMDWTGDISLACVELRGSSINRVNMAEVKHNHVGVFTGAGLKCVLSNYTDDADIDNNELITDTGGDGVFVTANSKRAYVGKKNNITGPANQIADAGEGTGGVLRTPLLTGNWAEYGGAYFSKVGYYKDRDGWVHLKGIYKDGTTTPGTVIFNLPIGYRPSKITVFFTISDGSGVLSLSEIRVNDNGDVVIQFGYNTRLSLDGMKFLAEQ